MTLSIVIPTYNGARYVAKAIESALEQSRPADEIIISDDNSTDDTIEICKTYGEKIKIYKNLKGPSGFVKGWNNAICLASSDYISILHQDDLLAPTFLEEVEKALNKYPDARHIVVACDYIDGEGQYIKSSPFNDGNIYLLNGKEYIYKYVFTEGGHIHRCPGVVTAKSIFKECKYREEAGHIADDDFFMRVGNYTDVIAIAKSLASYREHSGSETGHLSHLELVSRLQRDYIFQCHYGKLNPLFDAKLRNRYRRGVIMYSRWLLIGGLKEIKLRYILRGIYGFLFISLHRGNILPPPVISVCLSEVYRKSINKSDRSVWLRLSQDFHTTVFICNFIDKPYFNGINSLHALHISMRPSYP